MQNKDNDSNTRDDCSRSHALAGSRANWRLISIAGYPPQGIPVLVYLRERVEVCWKLHDCWYSGIGHTDGPYFDSEIDWWAPLPDGPEVDLIPENNE